MKRIPTPSPEAVECSTKLRARISDAIHSANGWISFSSYQELALYAPGLGYYTGKLEKFGPAGDFITAPELTPLFSQALAKQVDEIVKCSQPNIIEVGAGSGKLAVELFQSLEQPLDHYFIFEVSSELIARQKETIFQECPEMFKKTSWLDQIPESWSGCLIANEVLDALPVHCFSIIDRIIFERGVGIRKDSSLFCWEERPAMEPLRSAVLELELTSENFCSEIGLSARKWVSEWGRRLSKGAMIMIDYGLPSHELYHPQRNFGTVRCHYQHLHLDKPNDPFFYPGLMDITSHVDFSAVAQAGHAVELSLLGYCSQANFLFNCGIGRLIEKRRSISGNSSQILKAEAAVRVLLAPGEMGESIKTIVLGRNIHQPLLGFAIGDRRHTL